jgi:amino acid transporter
MTKKIILGGILAAVLMFLWSMMGHAVLPIGQMGFTIPTAPGNDEAVLAAMKSNLAPGMYYLPSDFARAASLPKDQREAAAKAAMDRISAGPRAVVIFHPEPVKIGFGHQLFHEFLFDLLAGWILAFALAMSLSGVKTFGGRVGYVTLLGLLPWIVISLSHWNWFEFPMQYEIGEFLDTVVGALLAGIGLAWLYRKD